MTDDLELLSPEPRRVRAGGRDIALLPLKIAKLAAFTKAASPVFGFIAAGDFSTAFVQGFEHLRKTVSIGAGVDEDFLDELDADEFLNLAVQVVETNALFLKERLMPAIAAAAIRINAIMGPSAPKAGLPSSPPLAE